MTEKPTTALYEKVGRRYIPVAARWYEERDVDEMQKLLLLNTVNELKYAHRCNVDALRRHFPNHCHERTSGMSDLHSTIKFCPKCQRDTDRNPKGKCRPCGNQRMAQWRLRNPEIAKARVNKWRAENPDKTRASAAAWGAANKDRKKAITAAWIAANPEKVKATAAAWSAANPNAKRIIEQNRRARTKALGGALSPGLTSKLFELQNGKCPCCRQPLGDDYHLDHIMPLALGGAHKDDNIQLLRAVCNMQKNSKHPVDFMQQRGFLV